MMRAAWSSDPQSALYNPQSEESAARRRDVITAWRRNAVDSQPGRGKNMPPPRATADSRSHHQLKPADDGCRAALVESRRRTKESGAERVSLPLGVRPERKPAGALAARRRHESLQP